MAWAVLVFTLFVVILYIALDVVLPSRLKETEKRPDGDYWPHHSK